MALSDAAIKAAKPRARPYKLPDAGGLFVLIAPSGGKLWKLKYRYQGREKKLSYGAYPDVTLAGARAKRDADRKIIAAGGDPGFEKKRLAIAASVSAANTFAVVAREFIDKREREGLRDATNRKSRWLLSLLEPKLGGRPIAEVEPYELLDVLRKVERAGHLESARRALSFASRVFRYAIATARANRDVAADLKGALTSPTVKHHAAIVDPEGVGGLLRALDGYKGQPTTRWALRLAPHVFQRPGELRQMEWAEVDLDAAVWRRSAAKMKMKKDHAVPLSTQALAILKEAHELTGGGRYVFPGLVTAKRPMSENTLNGALRRLGYSGDEMTSHGFRALASTLLNESGRWSPDAIERALAHGSDGDVRAIYSRGTFWDERTKMGQWWSDYLDVLRRRAEIGPLRPAANAATG
jgi:integrase